MTMKHYVSESPVYTGGQFYKPGTPFAWGPAEVEVTDENGKKSKQHTKPGDDWKVVPPKEVAAVEASIERVPDDADLEALQKPALQAVAFLRHVPGIKTLDEKGLKDAIRASYEPKL